MDYTTPITFAIPPDVAEKYGRDKGAIPLYHMGLTGSTQQEDTANGLRALKSKVATPIRKEITNIKIALAKAEATKNEDLKNKLREELKVKEEQLKTAGDETNGAKLFKMELGRYDQQISSVKSGLSRSSPILEGDFTTYSRSKDQTAERIYGDKYTSTPQGFSFGALELARNATGQVLAQAGLNNLAI